MSLGKRIKGMISFFFIPYLNRTLHVKKKTPSLVKTQTALSGATYLLPTFHFIQVVFIPSVNSQVLNAIYVPSSRLCPFPLRSSSLPHASYCCWKVGNASVSDLLCLFWACSVSLATLSSVLVRHRNLRGAQVKADPLVSVFLIARGDVRGSLGRLEEGRLADVALDVHSLLVLQHKVNVSQPLDFRIPQPESTVNVPP